MSKSIALTGWIKVEDRLPDMGVRVAAKRGIHRPFTCRWVDLGGMKGTVCFDPDNNYRDPTVWTPLPEPEIS